MNFSFFLTLNRSVFCEPCCIWRSDNGTGKLAVEKEKKG